MDSSVKGKFVRILRKPWVVISGIVFILLTLGLVVFGGSGGDGADPEVRTTKNLVNAHSSTLEIIDGYRNDINNATFKANLSEVSIILAANINELELYILENFSNKEDKEVKAKVSAKPSKELLSEIDDAQILNNLDSKLRSVIEAELRSLSEAVATFRGDVDDPELRLVLDKLALNIQTTRIRLAEGL